MPANYLHGVETIEQEVGSQTLTVVKSSVIALIGIAPNETGVGELVLCNNKTDDAQFGKSVPGFNIPKTLQLIRAIAGSCPVLVVNTFDDTANTSAVSLESHTITDGKTKLTYAPIGTVSIFESDGTTPADIVKDTDYTLDEFGNFTVISTEIADATVYKFTYKRLNGASVDSAQLIGEVDVDNVRTGMQLFDLAFNLFGYNPKVFIAPGYASTPAISAAMKTAAEKFRGVYCVDAPAATTIAGAIAGRGVAGTFGFNTSSDRALLLYPYLKAYDDYLAADDIYPYSAFMAAMIVKVDRDFGYWFSPSNKEIGAATGVERTIEWSINNADTEANQLNAAGIVTLAQGYGTGIRTWGNRNASYPTSTSAKNFISVRRTDDVVIESMELAALPFIDQPITQALIDTIREAGNAFIRTLIQRGAVLPGSRVIYNPADNPSEELAAGHITFERVYMVPTPAERITYKDVLDISLLNQFS